MKLKYLAFLLGAFSAAMGDSAAELKTVPSVDLNRYLGKWYEIARYPNRFEKNCVADVTAHYTLRDDGKINVLNSCRQPDGKMKSSKGSAKVADPQSNAKLKVTFFWPFYGNYWIIDLDPDYRYAVVSEPGRDYLWILSRTPQLPNDVYEGIATRLRAQGLDPGKLIKPKQSEK
jgi:apolipoprotein D and lipocalin family protein